MFLLFSTLPLYAQPDTNALPMLAPAHGELPPTFWEQYRVVILLMIGFIYLVLFTLGLGLLLRSKPATVLRPPVVARQALAKLQGQPEDGKILSEISQILCRYIAAILGFPSTEMTTPECCFALSINPQISPELAHAIASFLRECDSRKFSPAPSTTPFNGTDRALKLVELTEKHLRNASLLRATISPQPHVSPVTPLGNKPAP